MLRPCAQSRWDYAAQRRVVEQEDAHEYGEQIEEVVVASEHDQRLEQHDAARSDGPRTPRQEYEEDTAELDNQRRGCSASQKPVRRLRDVPGKRGWQRLRPEVIVECR